MTDCAIPYLFVKDVEVFSKIPNLYENLQVLADDWLSEFDTDFKVYFGIFYNTTGKNEIRNMHQKDNYTRHIVLNCDRKTRLVDCPKKNAIKTLGPNLKALDFDAGSQGDAIIPLDADIKNSVEDNLFDLISDYCPRLDTLWDESNSRIADLMKITCVSCLAAVTPPFSYSSDVEHRPRSRRQRKVITKVTKRKATSVFYKVSTNKLLVGSSFLEFEASKDDYMAHTIDIRCFDIKKLAIRTSFMQFLLLTDEPPINCDDKSYMDSPDFSLFYSDS
ncbi:uncharacterized protein EV154DRAFT_575998 [Mucor mucedo]|uniref:uncharacterized protein n=1 Tax=Mucor mucedo TaxID=29922 RepID=UPI002220DB60|nr:uncharacterized protein EV154DRAFT_575998 [Mucor mucedo]KAI7894994.1 hypothetical protein EV154DRAFT_575998 [Mucor mucedo]